ncbi:hypothetical protein [Halalkalibacter akibai]|uniref:hypothetical protein n=1 Tax=Halalkalibacter akibai TaxID=1411 RepID=UPI00054F2E69|nr:hypothetical protein [Halalkalibacter akibai]
MKYILPHIYLFAGFVIFLQSYILAGTWHFVTFYLGSLITVIGFLWIGFLLSKDFSRWLSK